MGRSSRSRRSTRTATRLATICCFCAYVAAWVYNTAAQLPQFKPAVGRSSSTVGVTRGCESRFSAIRAPVNPPWRGGLLTGVERHCLTWIRSHGSQIAWPWLDRKSLRPPMFALSAPVTRPGCWKAATRISYVQLFHFRRYSCSWTLERSSALPIAALVHGSHISTLQRRRKTSAFRFYSPGCTSTTSVVAKCRVPPMQLPMRHILGQSTA